LRDFDSQRSRAKLFDIFRSPCAHLWKERTQSTKSLPTSYAGILSTLNLAEVVTQRPVDGVAQREMQNFIGCSASGHTAEVRGRLICLRRSQTYYRQPQ